MGLDMYAYKVPKESRINSFKYDENKGFIDHCFQYWRKHHDLHGWFENLYEEKRGREYKECFNCVPLELTLEDLDRLEEDIKARNLPHTIGCFFGNNPPDDESDKNDLDFIARSRATIKEGDCIYYDSWW